MPALSLPASTPSAMAKPSTSCQTHHFHYDQLISMTLCRSHTFSDTIMVKLQRGHQAPLPAINTTIQPSSIDTQEPTSANSSKMARYPSPGSSPDLTNASTVLRSIRVKQTSSGLPTPISFESSQQPLFGPVLASKRKSKPCRSIPQPKDETDRVALGIVTLDVFSTLLKDPTQLFTQDVLTKTPPRKLITTGQPKNGSGGGSAKKRKGSVDLGNVKGGMASPSPLKTFSSVGKVVKRSDGPSGLIGFTTPRRNRSFDASTPDRSCSFQKPTPILPPPTKEPQQSFRLFWAAASMDEDEEDEEEGMEIVHDLEAMGKGHIAKALLSRTKSAKSLISSVPKNLLTLSNDPRRRVENLTNLSKAVSSVRTHRFEPIKSKLPPPNPSNLLRRNSESFVETIRERSPDGDENGSKRSRSHSPVQRMKLKKSKRAAAASSLAALEAAGKAASDAALISSFNALSRVAAEEARSDMDVDYVSSPMPEDTLLFDQNSALSSFVDATLAAGELVSLSQAASSHLKAGSAPPSSIPEETPNGSSSRASSNPPSSKSGSEANYTFIASGPTSSSSSKKKSSSSGQSNPPPKTRAAPTKASKPLPDFLGGGRRIKDRSGSFVEVEMSIFNKCDEGAPAMIWKGTPLTIPSTVQRYRECNAEEIETCSTLRMLPVQYLEIKETLLATIVVRGPYKKRDAQGWFRIDVNKTNKLYDWFHACGWIRVATLEWERREKLRATSSPRPEALTSTPSPTLSSILPQPSSKSPSLDSSEPLNEEKSEEMISASPGARTEALEGSLEAALDGVETSRSDVLAPSGDVSNASTINSSPLFVFKHPAIGLTKNFQAIIGDKPSLVVWLKKLAFRKCVL
ncbi:Transcriptional adapter ada2 [Dinochytrium kinnereticum]|nr:Transcriptional adapter ada2 [Dinochytrium kinnereticum]